jgi:uncharacterized phage-associated protein
MSNAEELMGRDSTSLTAIDIADYFIAAVDYDSGDNITNLKLQKLLYYAQGFHVAMREGQPLFSESVLAWKHGPVVRQVYARYNCQWHPIDPKSSFHPGDYAPEDRELLDAIWSTYGQFSAEKLEAMTHEESPWIKTPINRIISLDLLADYFTPLVEAGRRGQAVDGRPPWPAKSFRFQRRKELAKRPPGHRFHRLRLKGMACRGSIDGD